MAYRSIDPNTGEVIKTYDNHSDAELANALTAADGVYRSEWSRGPIERRLDVSSRLADRIAERGEELARIVAREMGKRIAEARREVALIAEIARYYAENAAAFLAPARLETRLGEACVEYHPIGVVVAIEPWNCPLYQLMRVCAPNIAAGNPVLAKHASIVPHCAVAFEELVSAAGAPKGVWTNIFASGEQVANLIADDRVQGVSLTGSQGWRSAARRSLRAVRQRRDRAAAISRCDAADGKRGQLGRATGPYESRLSAVDAHLLLPPR